MHKMYLLSTNECYLQSCSDSVGNADHDDVIKWKHFPRYWPFVRGIHRSSVNSPHKCLWRGTLMFALICARINGCVNSREAGDLRRYLAHCDVTVMLSWPRGIGSLSHKYGPVGGRWFRLLLFRKQNIALQLAVTIFTMTNILMGSYARVTILHSSGLYTCWRMLFIIDSIYIPGATILMILLLLPSKDIGFC